MRTKMLGEKCHIPGGESGMDMARGWQLKSSKGSGAPEYPECARSDTFTLQLGLEGQASCEPARRSQWRWQTATLTQ